MSTRRLDPLTTARWRSAKASAAAAVCVFAAGNATVRSSAADASYCNLTSAGTQVELVRPEPGEATEVDDVNWFARPVPNRSGHRIVAFASHDQNYLYDLTTGARVRIPDKSDAVATPDGRFVTVPSHYTNTHTVNFYDAGVLLARLDGRRDADDIPPVFAHDDPQLADVYYQSVGVISDNTAGAGRRTVYRMMFSGSRVDPAPGFRIIDYTVTQTGSTSSFVASRAMRLCPEIGDDMATPFISKDGRYVAAHDRGASHGPGTLKIFEITAADPAHQTTTCAQRADLGFAAGKADFSFDGHALTFHISKYNYLTPFVNGGIAAPTITDVIVMQLRTDANGHISGTGPVARVTTSQTEGVGSYFPAFFPDGRLFYVSNAVPKNSTAKKRFTFTVVDPSKELHAANLFADPAQRKTAADVGRLWRSSCASSLQDFKTEEEAAWYFLSLSPAQCRQLVEDRWTGDPDGRAALLQACTRRVSE